MSDNVNKSDGKSIPDPRWIMAAEMFAVGDPIGNIAGEFETTERTVYRWLEEPAAREVIKKIRSASVSSMTGRSIRSSRKAIRQFEKLLRSQDERMQLSAARSIVDTMLKLRAMEEFDSRLADIETHLGIADGKRKKELV